MGIGDIWDYITEKFGEGWEEMIGMFSNLKEFSTPGLIAGIIMDFLLFLVRGQLLNPFIKAMPTAQGIITMLICYIAVFALAYLWIKRAFER